MPNELLFRIFAAGEAAEIIADLRRLDLQAWHELIELALRHKCAPMLRERLGEWDFLEHVPEPALQRLTQNKRSSAVRNLRRFFHLSQLVDALGPAVPLIVLKGGRLARTHYRDISLRQMEDLDVLVRPEHLSLVAAKLEGLGFRQEGTCEAHPYQEERKDLQFMKQGEVIELHRSLLDEPCPFTVDYEGVWRRAMPMATEGLFYLSVEDQLVHLCLHATYHHKLIIGLYAFIDIGLMCGDPALDWQRLVERARAWQAERCVFLTLKVAQRAVGAAVPADIIRQLQPPGFNEEMVTEAIDTARTLISEQSAASRFAYTLAWYTVGKGWRRLSYTLQRRFLVPKEQRSRWTLKGGASWWAQLSPLVFGAQALISRRQWRLVRAHFRGQRLSQWMERPL